MIPNFIIDEIRRREYIKKHERVKDQPILELPLIPMEPGAPLDESEEIPNKSTIIFEL